MDERLWYGLHGTILITVKRMLPRTSSTAKVATKLISEFKPTTLDGKQDKNDENDHASYVDLMVTLNRVATNFEGVKKPSNSIDTLILTTKEKIRKMKEDEYPSYRHLFFIRKILNKNADLAEQCGNQSQSDELRKMENKIKKISESTYGIK